VGVVEGTLLNARQRRGGRSFGRIKFIITKIPGTFLINTSQVSRPLRLNKFHD